MRQAWSLLVLGIGALGCGDDGGDPPADPPGQGPTPFNEAGCASPSAAPGDNPTVQIQHEGQTRNYILYVPPGIDPKKPTPLVLNWHGLTSNAVQQQAYAGNAIADQRQTIVAYPDGLGNPGGQSFNAGACCGALGNPPHMADDVGFGRTIVADVASKLCVDKRRIYTTGMSNGGYMSEHNACHAADLYAAAAPVSAVAFALTDCPTSRPITIVSFNGTEDDLVNYGASQQNMEAWSLRNGCTGTPERVDYGNSYCETWSKCSAGVIVKRCTITGMEHCWPGNPLVLPGFCASGGLMDIDANQVMYDVFQNTTLP